MTRLKAFVIVALAVGFFAASADSRDVRKNRSDTEIAKILMGKWRMAIDEIAGKATVDYSFNEDGTFTSKTQASALIFAVEVTASGTWMVAKQSIELTVKESTSKPAGEARGLPWVVNLPVASIDESTLKTATTREAPFDIFKRVEK